MVESSASNSHAVMTPTLSSGRPWSGALAGQIEVDDAMAAATGLIEAASHPQPVCAVVRASRLRVRLSDADPGRAVEALRRGLEISTDGGNRRDESRFVAS